MLVNSDAVLELYQCQVHGTVESSLDAPSLRILSVSLSAVVDALSSRVDTLSSPLDDAPLAPAGS
jgi:hypothetical protein